MNSTPLLTWFALNLFISLMVALFLTFALNVGIWPVLVGFIVYWISAVIFK